MKENACQCGFGEEYFTIEGENSICTVCGGEVVVHQDLVVQEVEARRGKRILLVDDQAFFRLRIREVLSDKTHDIVEAGEGIEAVRLLAQSLTERVKDPSKKVDLVILDLTMPGLIDGFQTLGVIKAMRSELPVMILTASPPTPELLKKLGQLKAKKYLNKSSKNLEELLLRNLEALD